MGKIMRSYRAFTTAGYRILALYLIPFGFLVLSVLLVRVSVEREIVYFAEMILLVSYLVFYEVIVDYWVFGGLLGRGGENLALFKTSTRGLAFLGRAVAGDCLRRFCWLMIYAGVMSAVTGDAYNFVILLIAYVTVTGILNLSRHLQILQFHILCVLAAVIIWVTFVVFLKFLAEAAGTWMLVAELVLFSFLAVAVSGMSVWHFLYCMRREKDDQ